MTIAPETITPAGRPARVSSSSPVSGRPATPRPGRPQTRHGDPLSPVQAEVLAALRETGCQSEAARSIGMKITNMSQIMRALRLKGAIGPDEYRQSKRVHSPEVWQRLVDGQTSSVIDGPPAAGRFALPKRKAPPLRSAQSQKPGHANIFSREWKANGETKPIGVHGKAAKRVSPVHAKVEASRAARVHVLDAIHFSTQGHVLSSLRCSCGVRIRTCDPNRDRGHAKLYTLFEHHKNGPDVRGSGPRDESGRLMAA